MKHIFTALLYSLFAVQLLAETPVYMPKIVAHRGFSAAAPENTITAVKLAWDNADAAEIDLYRTADGEIILLHDRNLYRTSNKKAPKTPVTRMNLDEIRKYEVGSWKDAKFKEEKVPTLDEVFSIMPKDKKLFLEIKDCGPNFHTVLKEKMDKYKIANEQIFVISFDRAALADIEKNLPELNTFLLLSIGKNKTEDAPKVNVGELISILRRNNFDGASVKMSPYLDMQYIEKVKKEGFILGIYTSNDKTSAKKYTDYGVDFITTDNPPVIKKAISED